MRWASRGQEVFVAKLRFIDRFFLVNTLKTPFRTRFLALVLCVFVFVPMTSALAQSNLESFGVGSFSVDAGSVTAAYKQSGQGLSFEPFVSLGDTIGGAISPIQLPGAPSELGLIMRLSGSNPDLPFSIETFDSNFNVTAKFQGQTAGIGNVPVFVPLELVEGSTEKASVVGLQLTWDGSGAINIEVLSLATASSATPNPTPTPAPKTSPSPTPTPTPATTPTKPKPTPALDRLAPTLLVSAPKTPSVSTRSPRYVLRGGATDNITPARAQFRIRPPGNRSSYGRWGTVNLPTGDAKTKKWSHSIAVTRKGEWSVQIRVLDARGNVSAVRTVKIKRT